MPVRWAEDVAPVLVRGIAQGRVDGQANTEMRSRSCWLRGVFLLGSWLRGDSLPHRFRLLFGRWLWCWLLCGVCPRPCAPASHPNRSSTRVVGWSASDRESPRSDCQGRTSMASALLAVLGSPGLRAGVCTTASLVRWVVRPAQRTASYSTPSAMTGFTANVFLSLNRVSFQEAFEVLEPDDGKLSRPVLRGPGLSNGVRLLDRRCRLATVFCWRICEGQTDGGSDHSHVPSPLHLYTRHLFIL